MKPIYFPFTFVQDAVAQALAACCGPVIVYQPLDGCLPEPMQPLVDRGLIDIRVPVTGDEHLLQKAVADYQSWARLQLRDSGSAFLKAGWDRRPLFDTSAPSQIAAEIKARRGVKAQPGRNPALLAARMFLYFAQQFDSQKGGVDDVLQQCLRKEQSLMRQLQPQETGAAPADWSAASAHADDLDDYMLEARMEAWARLRLSDSQPASLFVTHRRSALEHVLEYAPQARKILEVTGSAPPAAPIAADALKVELRMQYLDRIARDPGIAARQEELPDFWQDLPSGMGLSIYCLSGLSQGDLFARCSAARDRQVDAGNGRTKDQNTLVGILDTFL